MNLSRPRLSNLHNNINITKTVINSIHAQYPGYLNCCHINAQSICAKNSSKMDELRDIFLNSKFDIIAVSESWLKPSTSNKTAEIGGYTLYRNDRKAKRSGGVAIYVKKSLLSYVVAISVECSITNVNDVGSNEFRTKGVQFLFLEINHQGRKLLFGVVYNPKPTIFDNRENLQPVFENLLSKYSEILITGDFNTNMLVNNNKTEDFRNFINEFDITNFSSQATHFAYHIRNSVPTCIDLLLTNRADDVLKFSQIDMPGVSNHDMIFFTHNFPTAETQNHSYFIRDYCSMDSSSVLNRIAAHPWEYFYSLTTANDLVDYFNKFIIDLFETYVPLKEIVVKNKEHPWFTDEIRTAINQRNIAHRIWFRSRTAESHQSFRNLRNKVNALTKTAKLSYVDRYIPSGLGSKETWKRIRCLGIASKDKQPIPFHPDQINSSFLSHSNISVPSAHLNHNSSLSVVNRQFSFSNVSPLEIFNAIMSITSNAIGFDLISLKFIKLFLPSLLPYITHIFNFILTSSKFPSVWKVSKIIPIPKKSLPKSVNDLRPISILSSLSKAFEKIIKVQINDFIDEFKLLSDKQSGFRRNHSTETALLSVTDDISKFLDEKQVVVLTLLDFSKAFDLVNHSILLHKLSSQFHFSSSACSLILSYLSSRSQFVSNGGLSSATLPVNSGVPQGSILGPLFFAMFINDLPDILQYCKCHMFADDAQIYFNDKSFAIDRIADCVNKDLINVWNWAARNKLTLNAKKSNCILFSTSNTEFLRNSLPPIVLNGATIPISNTVKSLGVMLDSTLNWESQITTICGRIYAGLRSLYSTISYTTLNLRIKLVKSLLIPHFIYCSSIMGSLGSGVFQKLRCSYYSCLRYIYNKKRFESVSHLSVNILGCSFKNFLDYRISITLHKILTSKQPEYLFKNLIRCRGERLGNLRIPRNRSVVRNKSFFVYGASLFNSLPTYTKTMSQKHFKTESMKFFATTN